MSQGGRQSRTPYRVFETEREYREHIARVVGWRIGREQDRTRRVKAEAERRAEAAEREVEELRRELRATVEQSYPRDDDGIRGLLR